MSFDYFFAGIDEVYDGMAQPVCYLCNIPTTATGYIRIEPKRTMFLCKDCTKSIKYMYPDRRFYEL
jgi:hypothetical protein